MFHVRGLLKKIRIRLFNFNRGIEGPLARIVSLRNGFTDASLPARTLVLFLATIFLVYKIYLFTADLLIPRIHQIFRLQESEKIDCLIFFDIFILILLETALLFFLALFTRNPKQGRKRFNLLCGKPVISLLLYASILIGLLLFTPTLIADRLFVFDRFFGSNPITILPHPDYAKATLYCGLGFGVYFADRNVEEGALHWWLLPFLFSSSEYAIAMPIVWYSCLSNFLPTRYWSLWRPLLTLASCSVLLMAYPVSQSIRPAYPAYGNQHTQKLPIFGYKNAYEATRVPGQSEFFVTGGGSLGSFRKAPDGKWKPAGSTKLDFEWDQTSYDFQRRLAYVQDMEKGVLNILNLENLELIKTIRIPATTFPIREQHLGFLRQGFDPVRNILAVVDHDGSIFTFDTQTEAVLRSSDLFAAARMSGVLIDSEKGHLLALSGRELFVVDLESLRVQKIIALPFQSEGMVIDEKNNLIYLAFPRQMKIAALEREIFRFVKEADAPAGVRFLQVDYDNQLLFLGAITGVVEVLELESLKPMKKVRLTPWIHWMEVFPEYKDAVVTVGDNLPVIWQYGHSSGKQRLFDRLFYLFEKGIRFFDATFHETKEMDASQFYETEIKNYSGSERILLAFAPDFNREILESTLKQLGYEVLVSQSYEDALKRIESDADRFDMVVLDYDSLGDDWKITENKLSEKFSVSHFLFVSEKGFDCFSLFQDRCVPKPVEKAIAVGAVRKELDGK